MDDRQVMAHAIKSAEAALSSGEFPVGAALCIEDRMIATAHNAIVAGESLIQHAEAWLLARNGGAILRALSQGITPITVYTTLEPCLMCLGAILLHGIGRVVIGTGDQYGGSEMIREKLPPFFKERFEAFEWISPLMPAECDPLHQRLLKIENAKDKA